MVDRRRRRRGQPREAIPVWAVGGEEAYAGVSLVRRGHGQHNSKYEAGMRRAAFCLQSKPWPCVIERNGVAAEDGSVAAKRMRVSEDDDNHSGE